jgi:hypothetical protein
VGCFRSSRFAIRSQVPIAVPPSARKCATASFASRLDSSEATAMPTVGYTALAALVPAITAK